MLSLRMRIAGLALFLIATGCVAPDHTEWARRFEGTYEREGWSQAWPCADPVGGRIEGPATARFTVTAGPEGPLVEIELCEITFTPDEFGTGNVTAWACVNPFVTVIGGHLTDTMLNPDGTVRIPRQLSAVFVEDTGDSCVGHSISVNLDP